MLSRILSIINLYIITNKLQVGVYISYTVPRAIGTVASCRQCVRLGVRIAQQTNLTRQNFHISVPCIEINTTLYGPTNYYDL